MLFSVSTLASANHISMKFDESDISIVLKALAEHQGLNLILSNEVQGLISVDLKNVPWQQALTHLLLMQGLEHELNNNILLVTPIGKLTEHRLKILESNKLYAELQPLKTKVVAVKYGKAKMLAETLQSKSSSLFSNNGRVTVDERTNSLLLQDNTSALNNLSAVIEQLDVKAQQVLIEARMVTVRENLDEQFGVQWGVTNASSSGESVISGTLSSIEANKQGDNGSYLDRLNVNLPVANPAGQIAMQVAKLSDGSLLDLQLSVLERESKGEVVASPRILATNQHTSRIEQGTEIPYLQAAAHGATSVAFKKAVLSLEVTPQITPSGSIILELNITQDARGDTVVTSTGPAVAIDTQQIKTKVSVNNGETLVLGGIYQQQMVKSISKVPWFAELPYIGWLFRTDNSYNEKRELLVFVTPQILSE